MKSIFYDDIDKIFLNNKKVFVEFWSEQCQVCFLIEPFLKKIEKIYSIEIYKINVLENEKVIQIYKINKLPTFIYFENGIEIVKSNGFGDELKFEKTFRSYLK